MLNLSKNPIKDEGIKEVANGILDRADSVDHEKQYYITSLAIRDTQIGDAGFKYLLSKLEQAQNQSHALVELDFSSNCLTDNSIRMLSDVLKKGNTFRAVQMANIKLAKFGDQTWQDLAAGLVTNRNLISIDLRGNPINEGNMTTLLEALQDNFVLNELKVDVVVEPGKQWWEFAESSFSSHEVLSMFDFFISREQVSL